MGICSVLFLISYLLYFNSNDDTKCIPRLFLSSAHATHTPVIKCIISCIIYSQWRTFKIHYPIPRKRTGFNDGDHHHHQQQQQQQQHLLFFALLFALLQIN